MNKILVTLLLTISIFSISHANEKYSDFTEENFYGKDGKISVLVRRFISKDPDTSKKVLALLSKDKDKEVRENVMNNPNYLLSIK